MYLLKILFTNTYSYKYKYKYTYDKREEETAKINDIICIKVSSDCARLIFTC